MLIVLTDQELQVIQGKNAEIDAWVHETPGAHAPLLRVVSTSNFKTEVTQFSTIMTVLMPTVSAEFPDELSATLFRLRWL